MEELKQQLNELLTWKKSLERSSTIPLPIDQSFRDRFLNNLPKQVVSDTKSSSSENQAVNEGGTATYNVLKPPDGFARVVLDTGEVVYIPYYD
jgi:hypothetical protein